MPRSARETHVLVAPALGDTTTAPSRGPSPERGGSRKARSRAPALLPSTGTARARSFRTQRSPGTDRRPPVGEPPLLRPPRRSSTRSGHRSRALPPRSTVLRSEAASAAATAACRRGRAQRAVLAERAVALCFLLHACVQRFLRSSTRLACSPLSWRAAASPASQASGGLRNRERKRRPFCRGICRACSAPSCTSPPEKSPWKEHPPAPCRKADRSTAGRLRLPSAMRSAPRSMHLFETVDLQLSPIRNYCQTRPSAFASLRSRDPESIATRLGSGLRKARRR